MGSDAEIPATKEGRIRVSKIQMSLLFTEIVESAYGDDMFSSTYADLLQLGWRFYITSSRRGTCDWSTKEITLPYWLWNHAQMDSALRSTMEDSTIQLYRIWYLAHEMAHAVDAMERGKSDHSTAFMRILKQICPSKAIGYEASYNTQTAIACGLVPNDLEGF